MCAIFKHNGCLSPYLEQHWEREEGEAKREVLPEILAKIGTADLVRKVERLYVGSIRLEGILWQQLPVKGHYVIVGLMVDVSQRR